jgi:hypothetical protein
MKAVLLGALIGAGLVLVAAGISPGGNDEVFSRTGAVSHVQANGELIAVSTVVGDKYQQLTVIDPRQQVLSVYHVQLGTGAVQLRCVRNLHWDLRMTEFNGESPLPREVQSLVEPR